MLRLVLVIAIASASVVDVGLCGDESRACPPACTDCVACLHGQAFECAEAPVSVIPAAADPDFEIAVMGEQQVDPRKVRHVPRA